MRKLGTLGQFVKYSVENMRIRPIPNLQRSEQGLSKKKFKEEEGAIISKIKDRISKRELFMARQELQILEDLYEAQKLVQAFNQIFSEEFMEMLKLKVEIEFKTRAYFEAIESIKNYMMILEKTAENYQDLNLSKKIDAIFAWLQIECFVSPYNAIHIIEKRIFPSLYSQVEETDRQKLQHLYFVNLNEADCQTTNQCQLFKNQ